MVLDISAVNDRFVAGANRPTVCIILVGNALVGGKAEIG